MQAGDKFIVTESGADIDGHQLTALREHRLTRFTKGWVFQDETSGLERFVAEDAFEAILKPA